MFCKKCGSKVEIEQEEQENIKPLKRKRQRYFWENYPYKYFISVTIIGVILGQIPSCVDWEFVFDSFFNIQDSMHKLQPPEKLKCVKHKGLCIAKSDVEYKNILYFSNNYNGYEYNKLEGAQRACQAWGGRLPHIEEFDTILDANSKLKIRLKTQTKYFSDTLDDPTRDDIIMTYQHDIGLMKYLNKIIYDNEPIGWTYKISFMNETPYRARCVKD